MIAGQNVTCIAGWGTSADDHARSPQADDAPRDGRGGRRGVDPSRRRADPVPRAGPARARAAGARLRRLALAVRPRRAPSPLQRATPSPCLGRSGGRVGPREGFLVVALTWLLAAWAGALPYLFSDEAQLSSPFDALFEGMSGFTTTGASVLTQIEAVNRTLLFWRSFSQWLGGMGIVVLALAVLPRLRVGGRQLFETEAPGPEIEPLSASIRDTARRLWVLYVALTVVCATLFAVIGWTGIDPEMDLYDAVTHAFTTLPTGGLLALRRQPRRLRAGDAVGRGRLHVPRRRQLRAPLPRVRAGTRADRRPRRGAAPLRGPRRRRVDRDGRRAAAPRRAAGRGGDPARGLPGRLDHHHHRLRDRRLRGLAADRGHGDRGADVHRRLGGVDDGLGQDRPASAHRPHPPARAGPDGPPGGRHAGAAQPRGRSTSGRSGP